MINSKVITLKRPGEFTEDPLTELLRTGARQLIADAVEAELQDLLQQYTGLRNEKGHLQGNLSPRLSMGQVSKAQTT